MNWYNSSLFTFGEIGNRLDGLRSHESYVLSANELDNLYVTDLGLLAVGKQYETALDLGEEILTMIHTDTGLKLLLGTTNIFVVDKSNGLVFTYEHSLAVDVNTRMTMFADQLHVTPNYYFIVAEDGTITPSNYLDTIVMPIAGRKDVVMDLYKIYDVNGTLEPRVLKTYTNPEIIVNSDGKGKISGTDMLIDRWYKMYRGYVGLDDITTPVVDMTFAVFHSYYDLAETPGDGTYLVGGTISTFEDVVNDPLWGSDYWERLNPVSTSGELTFGEIIDLKLQIVASCEFQNRYVLATKDSLYFSRTFDYNDFRNMTEDDRAFYIGLAPINNQRPNVFDLEGADGIWVSSDNGVYNVGYGMHMKPSTSAGSVRVATEIAPSREVVAINNDLVYIDTLGILRSLSVVYETGIITFKTGRVEKFTTTPVGTALSKGYVNGVLSILATTPNNKMQVHQPISQGVFRRYNLDITHADKILGDGTGIVHGGVIYTVSNINYGTCRVKLHPPYIKTPKGGTSLNDYESSARRVVINTINPAGLNHVTVNDITSTINHLDSLFKLELNLPIMDGIAIEFATKGDTTPIEIRTMDIAYDMKGN